MRMNSIPVLLLSGALFCAYLTMQFAIPSFLPAQETVLFEEHFDDSDWESRGWYDSPDMVLDSTDRVGDSGASAVFTWNRPGATTARSVGARVKFEPVEGFTMSCYMKFSDDWEWTGAGYHPHLLLFMTNQNADLHGPAFSHLTLYVEAVDGVPKLAIQDGQNIDQSRIGENLVGITENRAVAGGNGDSDDYEGNYYLNGDEYWNGKDWNTDNEMLTGDEGPFYQGDWHKFTAHFQLNSIIDGLGVANGVVQLWFDDSLVIDHHDVLLRTGRHENMKIDQFLLLPYYGPGVPHSQSYWIDELRIVRDERELPAVPPPVRSDLLFEETFDETGWEDRDWYDSPAFTVDSQVRMGDSGGSALFDWSSAGNTSPDSRGGRRQFDPAEGVAISYDIRFDDGWSFAGDSLFPPSLMFVTTSEDGQWANPVSTHLTLFLSHMDGDLGLGVRDLLNIDTQRLGEDLTGETENRAVAGGNGSSDSHRAMAYTDNGTVFNLKYLVSSGDSVAVTGTWHHVEAHIQLNSMVDGRGVANGVARCRIGNRVVMDYDDVVFRTGQFPGMKLNQLMLLPYIGGGVAAPQRMWVDNLKVEREVHDLPVPKVLDCDFNADGNVNILDVLAMIIAGRSNPQDERLDLDGDGAFGTPDVVSFMIDLVRESCR